MSQREYFAYCYECGCAGEIPLPLKVINGGWYDAP
jgi:hypothetical protein